MIKPNELGQPVTEADLLPFVNAQAPVYSQVIEELTAGCKRTHWMWFIFPQLRGLGHSAMAQRYAIRDLDQATRYLADPILGSRLRHDVRLMMGHKGFGSILRWRARPSHAGAAFDAPISKIFALKKWRSLHP